jgi:hypothetical protein
MADVVQGAFGQEFLPNDTVVVSHLMYFQERSYEEEEMSIGNWSIGSGL